MQMSRLAYLRMRVAAIGWLVLGRVAPARLIFDRMLVRWPDDAYALSSRANLLVQLRRRVDALRDLARLVQLHPEHAAHHFNHGFTLEAAGELEPARVAFRRATELDPMLDRAWYGLGLTLIRLHRFEEAEAALRRNTELQPMSPYGWYQLAHVHVDRHDPESALEVIRHLQGFEPKIAAQLVRETGLRVEPWPSGGSCRQ